MEITSAAIAEANETHTETLAFCAFIIAQGARRWRNGGKGMKETPILSINISEKSFELAMLAAQQMLNLLKNKNNFRVVLESNPKSGKMTIKIYPKDNTEEQSCF